MTAQTATTGAYEHLLVVMSIVIGLSVTQLLKGAAQLYRARARVRTYWLHWAWTILLLVFSLLVWWTYWGYRSIVEWDFVRFVLYLSPAVVFYFLSAITFPAPTDDITDLKAYYFANRSGFFGTFATYAFIAGVTAMIVRDQPFTDPSNLFRVGMIALMIVGMKSASARVHAAVFTVSAVLMIAFIAFYQFRLT